MARRIELREERRHGVSIIRPDGRLDSGQVDRLEELIEERIEDDKKRIVIDCANLHFIASSALRILLLTRQKVEADEGRLIVCNVKPHIKDVLQVAGFDRLLEVRRDLKAAMKDAIPEEMKAEAAAAERRKADAATPRAAHRAEATGPRWRRRNRPEEAATAQRVPKTATTPSTSCCRSSLLPFRRGHALRLLARSPFLAGARPAVPRPRRTTGKSGRKDGGREGRRQKGGPQRGGYARHRQQTGGGGPRAPFGRHDRRRRSSTDSDTAAWPPVRRAAMPERLSPDNQDGTDPRDGYGCAPKPGTGHESENARRTGTYAARDHTPTGGRLHGVQPARGAGPVGVR